MLGDVRQRANRYIRVQEDVVDLFHWVLTMQAPEVGHTRSWSIFHLHQLPTAGSLLLYRSGLLISSLNWDYFLCRSSK